MRLVNLAKILTLTRPLGIFDLETTGFDPVKDRIIQIGITAHDPDKEPVRWKTLINPGVPILNSDAHHITDEMVKDAPTFQAIASALVPRMLNIDLGGHNVRFDVDFFRAQCERVNVPWRWKGHMIDTVIIQRVMRPNSLSNLYEDYEKEPLVDAHDAGVDVQATEIVFEGQLRRWPDMPRSVAELSALCFPKNPNAIDADGKLVWNDNGEACIAFGKWAKNGPVSLKTLDRGYMRWVIGAEFPKEVKDILQAALMGVYPVKPPSSAGEPTA